MAIIPDVNDEAWNEQRQLLELSLTHALREWWRFTGQPARVSFPADELGLIVTIEHHGPPARANA